MLVATGRPSGIPEELNFPGIRYALTSNGARILDTQTGTVLTEELLRWEDALRALQVMRKYDTLPGCASDGQGYADRTKLEEIHDTTTTLICGSMYKRAGLQFRISWR